MHYISLPIYPLHFQKFRPTQKQQKMLRNCRYLMKTTVIVYLFFYKLTFCETLIIFLEPTIKLITGIFICQNNNNFCHDGTSALFRCFFQKSTLMPLSNVWVVKKIFIGLLTNVVNASIHTKYVSLSNIKCKIQPTLINLHPNEYTQWCKYENSRTHHVCKKIIFVILLCVVVKMVNI